jgi:hypothetical protein
MAMPVFRFITGSRSQEGTANQIAAMLGRVRSEAIGLQKPIGVAFFTDGSTGRSSMAEVEFASCPGYSQTTAKAGGYTDGTYVKQPNANAGNGTFSPPYFYYVYINSSPSGLSTPAPSTAQQTDLPGFWKWVGGPPIEIRPDTDVEALPAGIDVQLMCDYVITNNSPRASDSYLGVGAIFFDSNGALTVQPYGICVTNDSNGNLLGKLARAASLNMDTGLQNSGASMHGYPNVPKVVDSWDNTGNPVAGSSLGVKSAMGLVIFDHEKFVSQNFTPDDPLYFNPTGSVSGAYAAESAEEQWIDLNAQPLLINRFNGTLVKQD